MTRSATLRSQPYRLFFPLGIVLSWCGVGPWLLFGLGVSEEYRSIFHAMTQVQGFLMCFAMGFLFTMLPRRTESPPPSLPMLAMCALCPVGTTVAAWFERWIIAQAFWLILTTILLVFVLSRLVPILGTRRPPYCFVWIPAALVLGIVGTALTAIGAARSQQYWALHELGRSMVLQGLFLGLVLGVGSFALPLMTRGAPPPDAAWHRQAIWPLALHLLGVAALVASFLVETWVSVRLGLGLRGTVVWIVLLAQAHLFLPPTRTGFARWSMWLAAWCVPIGYTLAALSPFAVKGPLHVTFIGGFGLLALSVSSHVILGHGDYRALQSGYPRPLIAMTAALFLAAGARVMMVARGEEVLMWATLAAGLFLASTALWASFLVPRLFRPARADEI